MTGERGRPPSFFEAVGAALLPELQVVIAEALQWTDVPLSATDLYEMCDRQHAISALAYHLQRLAGEKLKAIELVHEEKRDGRWTRKWYFLRNRSWDEGAAAFQVAA